MEPSSQNKAPSGDRAIFEKQIREIVNKWYGDPNMYKEDLIIKLLNVYEKSRKRIRRI